MQKIILYLLTLSGLAGGIFYVHHLKTSAEAMQQEKIQAEKLARKEREAREAREREIREAKEREEREAKEQEARETREREAREARAREEKAAKERETERKVREEKERKEREVNQVLTALNSRIGELKNELEEYRIIKKDPVWHCFDLCINFGSVSFLRTMHSTYLDVGPGIYYIEGDQYALPYRYIKLKKCGYIHFDISRDHRTIPRGRPRSRRVGRRIYWEKVPVAYFCKRHNMLWNSSMVDNYRQHYISIRDMERREQKINKELSGLESKKQNFLKELENAVPVTETKNSQ